MKSPNAPHSLRWSAPLVGLALLTGACDEREPDLVAPIEPRLAPLLKDAGAGAPERILDLQIELAVPPLRPAPLTPMVTTYPATTRATRATPSTGAR